MAAKIKKPKKPKAKKVKAPKARVFANPVDIMRSSMSARVGGSLTVAQMRALNEYKKIVKSNTTAPAVDAKKNDPKKKRGRRPKDEAERIQRILAADLDMIEAKQTSGQVLTADERKALVAKLAAIESTKARPVTKFRSVNEELQSLISQLRA